MKVQVRHTLRTDVDSAFKLCTGQKAQDELYSKLGGSDQQVKRSGKAPAIRLAVSRRMPANPPAAIRKFVPATNEVSHTEAWAADGKGYKADIVVDIKGVPVKIRGTKSLQPDKSGSTTVEWNFDVSSGILLVGGVIAAFAGEELQQNLDQEAAALKKMI
jgi:hypothetical protein